MPKKFYPSSQTTRNLFMTELSYELNRKNPLYILRNLLDNVTLKSISDKYYIDNKTGRPKNDGLVMLKLLILQSIYGLSDNVTAQEFKENVYFQYFCGFEYFDTQYNISETCILRFRQSIGEDGLKDLLSYSVTIASDNRLIKKKTLRTL